MKMSVTNNGRQPVFMPGGKLLPGHTQTYELPESLAELLKQNANVDIKKVAVKKKVKKSGGI